MCLLPFGTVWSVPVAWRRGKTTSRDCWHKPRLEEGSLGGSERFTCFVCCSLLFVFYAWHQCVRKGRTRSNPCFFFFLSSLTAGAWHQRACLNLCCFVVPEVTAVAIQKSFEELVMGKYIDKVAKLDLVTPGAEPEVAKSVTLQHLTEQYRAILFLLIS